MVAGNKPCSDSATFAPTKNHPVIFVLEKYLVKYFHELIEKDVRQLRLNDLILIIYYRAAIWTNGQILKNAIFMRRDS